MYKAKILIFVAVFFQAFQAFAQNNDAELVNQETRISVNNGKLLTALKYEIKIYNRAGEKFTKVAIPFSKIEKVSAVEAYILDKDGVLVKKLKKSEITERSAISDISLYEDNFVKEFTLKHNSYPYSICYSYQVQEDDFLFVAYWFPVMDVKTPTLNATLNVELPQEYKISYASQFIDSFNVDSTGTLCKYTWSVSYNNVVKPETFSPPLENFLPKVKIVPFNFKYDISGSFKDWKTYGDWQNELIRELSDLPQNEKNKVISLTSGIIDEKEKIKKLYHYLQDETRYINITIETGGFKPYPASYVAVNKYGDCKALTNYFKSVLGSIGIPSFYTKVYAGEPIHKTDKNFPSPQFNHIILFVPLKGDTLWLDCTSSGPFNYLGTFTQNREAFIIKKNNSHFTRTPALSDDDVLETRSVSFSQNQEKEVVANFSNSYEGELFESLFYLSRTYNESDKAQIIRNNFIENGFDVIDFNLVEPPRDSTKIFFSYSAKSNKIYHRYGNEILIGLLPFTVPQFEKPEIRKLPVQLDCPVNKADTLEYKIPAGYSVTGDLKNQTIHDKYGRYQIEFKLKGDKVKVVKSFLLLPGYYPVEDYKDFYAFISRVKEIENNTYIITNKIE